MGYVTRSLFGVNRLCTSGLSALRALLLLAPIPRMSLAPLLNSSDVMLAAEVATVVLLARPAPLAGEFAGLATVRFRAELLAFGVAVVRKE